jgi:hypothetical protein
LSNPRSVGCHSPQAVHHGCPARHNPGGLSLRFERIAARAALPADSAPRFAGAAQSWRAVASLRGRPTLRVERGMLLHLAANAWKRPRYGARYFPTSNLGGSPQGHAGGDGCRRLEGVGMCYTIGCRKKQRGTRNADIRPGYPCRPSGPLTDSISAVQICQRP